LPHPQIELPYYPLLRDLDIDVALPRSDPRRYAILFSGGIDAFNNHIRYWNDLSFMYETLLRLGFEGRNIVVLYDDGKPVVQNDMPVHYVASEDNLAHVFETFESNVDDYDYLFIFTTNHGGGLLIPGYYPQQSFAGLTKLHIYGGQLDDNNDEPGTDRIDEGQFSVDFNNDGDTQDIVSWDEVLYSWHGEILDDAFPAMLEDLPDTLDVVIVMEQCFDQGLFHDLNDGLAQISDRVFVGAAGEYEFSWALDVNADTRSIGPIKDGEYDEFSYHLTNAMYAEWLREFISAAHTSLGVDADANSDGNLTVMEAFTYALNQDRQAEHPAIEDFQNGTLASQVVLDDVLSNVVVGPRSSWSPQQLTSPDRGTSQAPALAAYGNDVVMVWKGKDDDPRIFYSVYDGSSWSPQQLTSSDRGTSQAPALAVRSYPLGGTTGGAEFVMAWKGEGDDPRIYYSAAGYP
jgi:hypothetical protein